MPLTLAQIRARVETDLDNDTLQRIIDSAYEEIGEYAGSSGQIAETFLAGGNRFLSLKRRPLTVDSVDERATLSTESATTLAADDWRLVQEYKVLRLSGGTNSRSSWGMEVVVTYSPEVDSELRDRVASDLVQMDVEFRALEEESEGDYEGNQADYAKRKRDLLRQIREGRSVAV